MLSEDQARILLRDAGETICVDADPALPGRARHARRRRVATIAAAAVTVGMVGAGTTLALASRSAPSGDVAGPSVAESPTVAVSPSVADDLVTIPDVRGLGTGRAKNRLEQLGFRVTVVDQDSCRPAGIVIEQEPAAGRTVKQTVPVQLMVSGENGACEDDTITPADEKVADYFIAFARQAIPNAPPSAPTVTLGLGWQTREQVPAEKLTDRSAWMLEAPYAERSGPFSALELIDGLDDSRGLVVTDDLDRPACVANVVEPPETYAPGGRMLSIQPAPDSDRPCMAWWSVDLTLDASGRLTGAYLLLGAP